MVQYLDIGRKPYLEVFALQREFHAARVRNETPDTVIFCEHPPVYTIGRQDCSGDWLSDFKQIAGDGIDVVKTDRGGRITYHGPGQLVAYFIFNIAARGLGVKAFVNMVEEACIKALAEFEITAERDANYPGLWVNIKSPPTPLFQRGEERAFPPLQRGERGDLAKIAALGFHVSHDVTTHGLALNIAPDLTHYKHIVPCGIKDRGITSIKEITGTSPDPQSFKRSIEENVNESFPSEKRDISAAFLASSGIDLRNSS